MKAKRTTSNLSVFFTSHIAIVLVHSNSCLSGTITVTHFWTSFLTWPILSLSKILTFPLKRRVKSHLLTLLEAHHILHVSTIRVNIKINTFLKFRNEEGVHEKWLLYDNESLYYVYHMLYSTVFGTKRGCRQLPPATAVTRPQPNTHPPPVQFHVPHHRAAPHAG